VTDTPSGATDLRTDEALAARAYELWEDGRAALGDVARLMNIDTIRADELITLGRIAARGKANDAEQSTPAADVQARKAYALHLSGHGTHDIAGELRVGMSTAAALVDHGRKLADGANSTLREINDQLADTAKASGETESQRTRGAELAAMSIVATALEPLDAVARKRVVGWALDCLAQDENAAPPSPPAPIGPGMYPPFAQHPHLIRAPGLHPDLEAAKAEAAVHARYDAVAQREARGPFS
jgi:hypothetical protein